LYYSRQEDTHTELNCSAGKREGETKSWKKTIGIHRVLFIIIPQPPLHIKTLKVHSPWICREYKVDGPQIFEAHLTALVDLGTI
jgi:hypothetical protein